MTSYRGMDGVSGRPGVGSTGTQPPTSPVSFTGNFISGVDFTVTQGGCWFEGYWFYVAPGAPTTPQKFALWTYTNTPATNSVVIPGSVVTSGTLTNGWNFVAITPIPLAIGTPYMAATGVNGKFSDTASQFNSGDPYAAGIVNGPLHIYSDKTGSFPSPADTPNETFSVSGTDPSIVIPLTDDSGGTGGSNFWIDVQVTDTAPANSSFRLQPNSVFEDAQGGHDDNEPYNLATEFDVTAACVVNKIWFLSPAGADGGLPTETAIWSIQGPNAGTKVFETSAPSWSGSAGTGWISINVSGVVLQPGSYKVACYNKNGATGTYWNYKRIGFWAPVSGFRQLATADVVCGPITFPIASDASMAYHYNGSAGAGNPPNSDGTTLHGQGTFAVGDGTTTAVYPYLYVQDGTADGQFYGVDVEVTPAASATGSLALRHLSFGGAVTERLPSAGVLSLGGIGFGGSGTIVAPPEEISDFGDEEVQDLFDKLLSFALESGRFDAVNTHEPKNSPGNGVSMSLWIQDIRPVRTSGLNSTSALLLFTGRIYTSMTSEPYDLIDPNVLSAAIFLIGALSGDFELGGDDNVRMIDLLGSQGEQLAGRAGYVEIDRKMYRVMTITIPIIINDMWSQER